MVMKDRKQAVMEAKEYKSRRRRRRNYNKKDDENVNWRVEIVMINEAFQVIPQYSRACVVCSSERSGINKFKTNNLSKVFYICLKTIEALNIICTKE